MSVFSNDMIVCLETPKETLEIINKFASSQDTGWRQTDQQKSFKSPYIPSSPNLWLNDFWQTHQSKPAGKGIIFSSRAAGMII